LSVAIGVLKYRLYEIGPADQPHDHVRAADRPSGRRLSRVVVLSTDVLPFSSPVGVAASTLAAAALFNPPPPPHPAAGRPPLQPDPLRRAEAMVAAFDRRLRDASDPEGVEAGLATPSRGAVAAVARGNLAPGSADA